MTIDRIVEFIPPLEFDGIKDYLIMEPKMIDPKTLDEWEAESTNWPSRDIGMIFSQRILTLIQEIRRLYRRPLLDEAIKLIAETESEKARLLTENREFRDCLKFYADQKYLFDGLITIKPGKRAREVLAKFPGEKK